MSSNNSSNNDNNKPIIIVTSPETNGTVIITKDIAISEVFNLITDRMNYYISEPDYSNNQELKDKVNYYNNMFLYVSKHLT